MTSKNVHTFELKLGKRALFLFIIGMSCLLFIVFLFGVTVGKNIDTYPEKFARGIPGMIKEKLGWSSHRTETAETVSDSPKEYARVDSEEGVAEEKRVLVSAPAVNEEKQPAVRTQVSNKEQRPLLSSTAEQAKKRPLRADEKYMINLVSYKEKEKANRLLKKMRDLGFTPKVTEVDLHEKGKWFRVTLEGFDSREKAQKTADDVSKKIKDLNCAVHKMALKSD